ncbi:S8 family serine peptidase [Haloterrigena sp. SYSU A121-1]|uniref:S8 family serine peptidase n=2 Tax=Haloterrigena gelatinilytica TaxID=2741724 RepID=A0A8J8KG47_9EURY|nr:S8 family serine peptidase [Haloterrigena gelatinilytica]
MSKFPIGRRRLFALSLVALLCTSLLLPVAVAAAGDSVADTVAPGNTDRYVSTATETDVISPERSGSAQIDSTLEGTDGVVEAIVRFEAGETAPTPISTDQTEPTALRMTANRSQSPLERAAETTAGLEIEQQFWLTNAAQVRIDTDRVDLESVAAIDGVVEIHADAAVELTTTTNATASTAGPAEAARRLGGSYTNGLEQLSIPEVHEKYGARGAGATVAVLDTGADDTHPDVQVDGWRDFSGGSSTPIDYNTHGTHVAGTVAGGSASGTQIGVAPEATLLVGAVLTDCSDGSCVGRTSDVIAGMEWAVANGADVISLSLGSEGYTASYISAVRNAEASGTVVVAGAGNSGDGISTSPGNVYDVISVGAVDEYGRVTAFSSGETIDTSDAWGRDAPSEWPNSYLVPTIVAPGDRVLSAAADGGYVRKRGTSMATPHVAGVIALLQGATDRSLEPEEIKTVLRETAAGSTGEPDTRYGHGIVDATAALEEGGSFATVEGTVSDTVTDDPIESATVSLEAPDGTSYETTADFGGGYDLKGVPGDRKYTLTVTAPGYESTSETVFLPADERTRRDVSLAGNGELEAVLEDAQFGNGLANGTVNATAYGTYPLVYQGDGVYTADHVPSRGRANEYTLTATAPGYESERRAVAVTDGQRATERFELTGDATLEVVAEDAMTGTAVSNASVTIERPDGTAFDVDESTADDGVLTTPVPGTDTEYTVRVAADGYETATATVTVASGETVTANVSLEGDAVIAVALEDAQFGDGITEASVEATGDRGTYSGTHEGNGEYVLEPVPGGDEYAINVTAAGYVNDARTVSVGTNGAASDRIVLEGDATLLVTVVDEADEPVGDATVTIERPDGASFTATEESNANGTLEATVPGSGTAYALTVDAQGYASETVSTDSVPSGATESVTVTVATVDGVPGFGVPVAAVALLATLAVSVSRGRA